MVVDIVRCQAVDREQAAAMPISCMLFGGGAGSHDAYSGIGGMVTVPRQLGEKATRAFAPGTGQHGGGPCWLMRPRSEPATAAIVDGRTASTLGSLFAAYRQGGLGEST